MENNENNVQNQEQKKSKGIFASLVIITLVLVLIIGIGGGCLLSKNDGIFNKNETLLNNNVNQANNTITPKGLYSYKKSFDNEGWGVSYSLYLYDNGTFKYGRSISMPEGEIGTYEIKGTTLILKVQYLTGSDTGITISNKIMNLQINNDNTITDTNTYTYFEGVSKEVKDRIVGNAENKIILTKASEADEKNFLKAYPSIENIINNSIIDNGQNQTTNNTNTRYNNENSLFDGIIDQNIKNIQIADIKDGAWDEYNIKNTDLQNLKSIATILKSSNVLTENRYPRKSYLSEEITIDYNNKYKLIIQYDDNSNMMDVVLFTPNNGGANVWWIMDYEKINEIKNIVKQYKSTLKFSDYFYHNSTQFSVKIPKDWAGKYVFKEERVLDKGIIRYNFYTKDSNMLIFGIVLTNRDIHNNLNTENLQEIHCSSVMSVGYSGGGKYDYHFTIVNTELSELPDYKEKIDMIRQSVKTYWNTDNLENINKLFSEFSTTNNDISNSTEYSKYYISKIKELNYEDDYITYGLAYVDQSNIPYLIVDNRAWACLTVYKFNENEVITLKENDGYGTHGRDGYDYIEGKNIIRDYCTFEEGYAYEIYNELFDFQYSVECTFNGEYRYISKSGEKKIITEDEFNKLSYNNNNPKHMRGITNKSKDDMIKFLEN